MENDELEFDYQPHNPEKPDRISQLFYNLCRGHAVICDRSQINQDDLSLIIELSIDSTPPNRAKLLKILIEHNGELKTSEVEQLMKCKKTAALREMVALEALDVWEITETHGMVGQPEKIIRLKQDFRWFLSDECKALRKKF